MAQKWRTVSYLLTPDASSQMSHGSALHSAPMRQTEPRFLAAYFDAAGPGPRYNSPDTRTAFPKPYLRKHTTFGRSERFLADAFAASRGNADPASPGPARYPPPPSAFDKHVRSASKLRPGARRPEGRRAAAARRTRSRALTRRRLPLRLRAHVGKVFSPPAKYWKTHEYPTAAAKR